MKKILYSMLLISLSQIVSAKVPDKFPVVTSLNASQFDKSELKNKSENKRREGAKSVPVEQAVRCIAFTYGAHTLEADGKRKNWEDHLKYFHDKTSMNVVNIKNRAERDMKSILAKSDVTWKDVHRTYYRECSGYWKISSN